MLCLPRFRGFGYSKEFTANMARIAKILTDRPQQLVELVDGPDDICHLCPHLAATGECVLEEQVRVSERDGIVLKLLGVLPGKRLSYLELTARLAAVTDSSLMEKACAGCRWQQFCVDLPAR